MQQRSPEVVEHLLTLRQVQYALYDVALLAVSELGELPPEELLYVNAFLDALKTLRAVAFAPTYSLSSGGNKRVQS